MSAPVPSLIRPHYKPFLPLCPLGVVESLWLFPGPFVGGNNTVQHRYLCWVDWGGLGRRRRTKRQVGVGAIDLF